MKLASVFMFALGIGIANADASTKWLVMVDSFTIKCSEVSSGSGGGGFTFSGGVNNTSAGGGASGPEPLALNDPASFATGLAERLESALASGKNWSVVDLLPAEPGTPVLQEPEARVKPQFLIRATAIDMNVSNSNGGVNIGPLGGGQKQVRNKVVLDIKLVDPKSQVILETVRGTGSKTTKSNFLAGYGKGDVKLFGWEQFKESPLSEAADLAIQDGVKKLGEKLAKYPWEASIAAVTEESGVSAYYLNVGPESGLVRGQVLELFVPGVPIVDEKSGKVLGKARPKILGKVRVIDVESELVVVEPIDQVKIEVGHSVRLVKK